MPKPTRVTFPSFFLSALVTLFLKDSRTLFAAAFGTSKEDANFDERCDFNDDGNVNGVDLIILSYNFGESI